MNIGTYKPSQLAYLRERNPGRLADVDRLIGIPDKRGLVEIDTHGDLWRELHGQPPLPRHSHAEPRTVAKPIQASAPQHRWPMAVRIMAKMRKPEDRGVGDTVDRMLGVAGDAYKWFWSAIGMPCGCTDRQVWLNQRYPYPVVER